MKGVIKKVKGVRKFFIDGEEVSEEDFDTILEKDRNDAKKGRQVARPRGMKRGYPIKSMALECHPDSIPEARENLRKRGVPTDYTPQGQPILRDAGHRRAVLRALGLHDRNSYTGY